MSPDGGSGINPDRGAQLRKLFSEAMRGENLRGWALSVYEYLRTHDAERVTPELADWPEPPSVKGNPNPAIVEAARKADLKGTCTIRLRASMRAESILRGYPDCALQAHNLGKLHREHWRIARVSDDYSEREQQIADALRVRYGR